MSYIQVVLDKGLSFNQLFISNIFIFHLINIGLYQIDDIKK
tara:strand:- start:296 stop:418 length:123 start_codon:yes stop_codon:yes gene_type:complete